MYFTGAIRKNKVFMVFHSCWHNFPVGTTSHWNNFPLEQLPKSQLPTGTTSLFIQLPYSYNFPMAQLTPGTTSLWHNLPLGQLPYGTTYPWYNFPMAQLTPGTTSLWHNLPLAQLILEQLPYGTSSYGTTSRGLFLVPSTFSLIISVVRLIVC